MAERSVPARRCFRGDRFRRRESRPLRTRRRRRARRRRGSRPTRAGSSCRSRRTRRDVLHVLGSRHDRGRPAERALVGAGTVGVVAARGIARVDASRVDEEVIVERRRVRVVRIRARIGRIGNERRDVRGLFPKQLLNRKTILFALLT